MIPTRAEIEAEVERLIAMLDEMDGDPDFEPEPPEEQHDTETDLAWNSGVAPHWFVVAETARRKSKPRR